MNNDVDMASPIRYHKLFRLKYTTYCYDIYGNTKPQNVLTDDNNSIFDTENNPNQWWQISFSKVVYVESYIIRSAISQSHRPKSWIINTSFDNMSWRTVDHVSLEGDVGGNKTPFKLNETIPCLHFRIVLLSNSISDRYELKFSFFDCFCKIPFEQCFTKRTYFLSRRLFIGVLITCVSYS